MRDRDADRLDVALGSATVVGSAALRTVRVLTSSVRPLTGLLLRPPLLDSRLHPERLVRGLSAHGRRERAAAVQAVEALTRALVPRVTAAVLDQLDLTAIVLERVDIDAVAGRLDLETIIARVDVDAVVARADLDAIAGRLDLNRLAEGIDVDEIAARMDLDAIVGRLDLVALATWVIDGIDLPEIIRESTGSVASETIRGVRMQSVEADLVVGRAIDRLLLRRRGRRVETPWGESVALEADPGERDGGEPT